MVRAKPVARLFDRRRLRAENRAASGAAEDSTMNTARLDIEMRETAGLKSCHGCSRELRQGDKFCRRCGASQSPAVASLRGGGVESKYRTSRLPEADGCHRFSGSLMKSLLAGASARASRTNSRSARLVVSMLAAPALWMMIVLLSPFDAYAAARSIAHED